MDNKTYVDAIKRGNFLYWDMLGKLRGTEPRAEDGLRWLTGNIYYNYHADTADVDGVIRRMKNEEIPKNLVFLTENLTDDPAKPFKATGLFKEGYGSTGMAHELLDTPIPKADKRLNLFRVREISQLKATGAIFNAAFEYSLFAFEHYLEMMNNNGQFFYLAEVDGLPAGACMAQHGDIFVNISWAGTLPKYRGIGVAGQLIHMAEQDGLTSGKSIGVLYGRPGAVGAYRRIGYRDYCKAIDLELLESLESKK